MKISIIGGGPAGLIAALYLSRIPEAEITVFERKSESDYHASLCAEGISLDKLNKLEQETGFCSRAYIARQVNGIRVFFPNRKYGIVQQGGATLRRTEWQRGMVAFLRQRGVRVAFSTKFLLENQKDEDWVVGADGPASKLRARIDGRVDLVPSVQYRMRLDWCEDYFDVFVGSMFHDGRSNHAYGWIFPKGNGVFNVGTGGNFTILDNFINDYNIKGEIEDKGAAPIAVNGTVFEHDRVLLIGDAAGLTNPITCGGLSAIICCAGYLYQAITSARPGVYTRKIKAEGLFPADWHGREKVFYPPDKTLNKIGVLSGNRRVNPPGSGFLVRLAMTPGTWLPCLNLVRFLPALKRVSW